LTRGEAVASNNGFARILTKYEKKSLIANFHLETLAKGSISVLCEWRKKFSFPALAAAKAWRAKALCRFIRSVPRARWWASAVCEGEAETIARIAIVSR
jgi:hypothetical protein